MARSEPAVEPRACSERHSLKSPRAYSLASVSKPIFSGQTKDDLAAWMAAAGEPGFRTSQILEWHYEKRALRFEDMTSLPAALRSQLAEGFELTPLHEVRSQLSVDGTRKFLFRLHDDNLVESVLIPASPALYGSAADRRTLCVSSQVGCAFDCQFCASGLAGFTRNLDPGEIVSQILEAERISGEKVNNVVFMGMGEPLANYRNLLKAVEILNAEWGVGIGARRITVSTSGVAPRIRDLADQPLAIRLALSLHGATDEVRQRIMPVNRKYPLEVLFEALQHWRSRKKQKVTFEYIMIDGLNDTPEQAAELAKRARSISAKVNLIPYNSVADFPWARSTRQAQKDFLSVLERAGVPATIRLEKGHDIDAACGQLRLREETESAAATEPATTSDLS